MNTPSKGGNSPIGYPRRTNISIYTSHTIESIIHSKRDAIHQGYPRRTNSRLFFPTFFPDVFRLAATLRARACASSVVRDDTPTATSRATTATSSVVASRRTRVARARLRPRARRVRDLCGRPPSTRASFRNSNPCRERARRRHPCVTAIETCTHACVVVCTRMACAASSSLPPSSRRSRWSTRSRRRRRTASRRSRRPRRSNSTTVARSISRCAELQWCTM